MRERWYAAGAGIASAGVALGVAEIIAVGTGARSAPLIAVGGVVVDLVPEWLKSIAIDLFGTYDKVALLTLTGLLLTVFAAVIGIAARRRLWVGLAGIGVFAVIGVVSAVTRPNVGAEAALPSLLGSAVGALALWLLMRLFPAPGAEEPDFSDSAVARRKFLWGLGSVVGVAAISGVVGRMWASRKTVQIARQTVVLPTPVGTRAVAPAQADFGVANLAPYTTPNEDFYRIDTALVVPQVDPSQWTLRIHGRVGREITLSWADLLSRPMVERYVTLACVSNEVGGDLIGNARWLGVPVKDLLAEADPDPAADQVVSRSVDGFTAGTPTAALMDGRDALVAVAMNGEPLPVEHGFPARLVVPGLYGYVSATKWLAELELTTFADFDAYWIPRGWAQQAEIKTQSRIDVPRSTAKVSAGPVVVAGVAWAQHRGISTVEVQVDDGEWNKAELAATVSVDTWRQWRWTWPATTGEHLLRVRATDNGGDTQTSEVLPPAPDGATGYHEIIVTVN